VKSERCFLISDPPILAVGISTDLTSLGTQPLTYHLEELPRLISSSRSLVYAFCSRGACDLSELSKKVDLQTHTTRTYTTGLFKLHQKPSTVVYSQNYTISPTYLHFQIISFRPEINLTGLNVGPSIARDAKYLDVIDTDYTFTGDIHVAETMLTFSTSS
jgi:hypothetical protein